MADITDKENWAGPCKTIREAIETIQDLAGTGYTALVWQEGEAYYINDGIDPDTGKRWADIPEGAKWLDV